MKQTIRITYNGAISKEIDSRLADLLEATPLNFEKTGQGYNVKTGIRDIQFERETNLQVEIMTINDEHERQLSIRNALMIDKGSPPA